MENVPDEKFIGKYVHFALTVRSILTNLIITEYCWCTIESVKSHGLFNAILDNIPYCKCEYHLGSTVVVDKSNIIYCFDQIEFVRRISKYGKMIYHNKKLLFRYYIKMTKRFIRHNQITTMSDTNEMYIMDIDKMNIENGDNRDDNHNDYRKDEITDVNTC